MAAWLFNRAQNREVAFTVSEKLKRRDADEALRGIAKSSAGDDPSASYFVGENLIGELLGAAGLQMQRRHRPRLTRLRAVT